MATSLVVHDLRLTSVVASTSASVFASDIPCTSYSAFVSASYSVFASALCFCFFLLILLLLLVLFLLLALFLHLILFLCSDLYLFVFETKSQLLGNS